MSTTIDQHLSLSIPSINNVSHHTLLKFEDSNKQHNNSNNNSSLRTLLDKLFPSDQYNNQHVSISSSSRSDIQELEHKLDQLLQQRNAKSNGICYIRHDIHNDLYDELIRQCSIDDSKIHGILLYKIKNYLNNAIYGYEQLLDNTSQYNIEQSCNSEINRDTENDILDQLNNEYNTLLEEYNQQQHNYNRLCSEYEYDNDIYNKKYQDIINYWKQCNTQLQNILNKYQKQKNID